jgi:Aldehyde dehydrogenase family
MQMYVAGEWTSAASEDEIRNPWSGETVDTVPRGTAADVDAALAAAVEGARVMRRLPAHERVAILERAADLIEDAREEIARTITAEEGKPLSEAMGEAERGGGVVLFVPPPGARPPRARESTARPCRSTRRPAATTSSVSHCVSRAASSSRSRRSTIRCSSSRTRSRRRSRRATPSS